MIKLGSLFDGAAGFPLAAMMHGIHAVWASEIESYPLRVSKKNFPHMLQLGDITKINGAKIEPVDIITFGSPCQDLSKAGEQKGIVHGERSRLFFDAIRICNEMRCSTSNKFPRFIVWENVSGAFGSNGGEDFQKVLQTIVNLCDRSGIYIPRYSENGKKWFNSGAIVGESFSIAWRQYDAQYWGVPQRRKRIYLIADFRSERAAEILFARERNPTANFSLQEKWIQSASNDYQCNKKSEKDETVYCIQGNTLHKGTKQKGQGINENTCFTLTCNDRHAVIYSVGKRYILRYLTPLEYCRAQGFPDSWEDGCRSGDHYSYKMWGNSIAIPCAADVLGRIADELLKGS